jgi:hypothetical protein
VLLPALQEVNANLIQYNIGTLSNGQLAKTAGYAVSIANDISGGAAGQVVYQTGVNQTGFTAVGSSAQLLQSNGAGAPTWIGPNNLAITSTGSTTARTLANRFADVINVLDFGADNTGVVDSYTAFAAAINALPAGGGKIIVPTGTYLLNTEPTWGTKSIYWDISPNAIFTGSATGIAGGFPTLSTNIGNIPVGPWVLSQTSVAPQNYHAGIIGGAFEMIAPTPANFPIVFTGTATIGSNVITNVSSTTGLGTYQSITVSGGASPFPDTLGSFTRITTISGSTVTVTNPATASGTFTFNARFWAQHCALYAGSRGNNASRDASVWAQNNVLEVMNSAAGGYFGLEINVVCFSNQPVVRGISITDNGTQDADVGVEILCQTNNTGGNWFTGQTISQAYFGHRISVKNTAVQINTTSTGNDVANSATISVSGSVATLSGTGFTITAGDYIMVSSDIRQSNAAVSGYTPFLVASANSTTITYAVPNGTTTPTGNISFSLSGGVAWNLTRGIAMFPNGSSTYIPSLLSGMQKANGEDCLWLQRYTDTSPTGNALIVKNQANTNDLALINVDGSISTYASATASNLAGVSANTARAGSISCNGINLRGTTNLMLGNNYTAGVPTATGYVVVYDNSGRECRLLTA